MACINYEKMLNYSFSDELVLQTRDMNKLLTLELELSRICNYKCRYCYSAAGAALKDELEPTELFQVIDQAKDLGVRTIIIIGGGEPLLYPFIKDIIKYIHLKGIKIVIFTNGAKLNQTMSEFLYSYDVFPVLKANGITPRTMNWLCGVSTAYSDFIKALTCLNDAGYMCKNSSIGISTVICRQNYSEIVPLWRWVRKNKFIPYFERVSLQGRANNNLEISSLELKKIFDELSQVDQFEYGIEWNSSHPPIAGFSCRRHYYSLYVKSNGDVIPCSGIDLTVGNVRTKPIKDIINESKIIQELRHIESTVKGKCYNCDLKSQCYGCRGNAYTVSGDYLAEDPYCWRQTRDKGNDSK